MNLGKQMLLDDPTMEAMHLHATASHFGEFREIPAAWCAGSPEFAKHWRCRWQRVEVRASAGHPSLAEIVKRLEDAGFLVNLLVGTATPHNDPMCSMFDGFFGFAPGIIEESMTLTLVEIARAP